MRAARVAGERQALPVDAERGALPVQVGGHGGHLPHGRGVLRLGRQPVVHGHHHRAGLLGQDAADAVVRVQVAQHEPAAMRVYDARRGALARRAARGGSLGRIVAAHRDGAVGAGHLAVGLLGHGGAALGPPCAPGHVVLAHPLEARGRVVRVARQLVFAGQHGSHLRIDLREHVDLVHGGVLSSVGRMGAGRFGPPRRRRRPRPGRRRPWRPRAPRSSSWRGAS